MLIKNENPNEYMRHRRLTVKNHDYDLIYYDYSAFRISITIMFTITDHICFSITIIISKKYDYYYDYNVIDQKS